MPVESYEMWRIDRGLKASVDSCFDDSRHDLYFESKILIIVKCNTSDKSSHQSIQKLSDAISEITKSKISMYFVSEDEISMKFSSIQFYLKNIEKVILLVDDDGLPNENLFSLKIPKDCLVKVFTGPKISILNGNLNLKRKFWTQVCQWLINK